MTIYENKNKKVYIIRDVFVNVSHKTKLISMSNVFGINALGTTPFRN